MSRHPDRERLHAFVEGRLDGPTAARVADHLGDCWACAARLREIDALRAAAHELRGPVEPRRDLWPAIEGRVRSAAGPGADGRADDARRPRQGGAGAPPASRAARLARWAGVAAVLLLAAVATLRFAASGPDDPAQVASTDPAIGDDASAAGLEARYGPELRRLASLVESRSRERGLDVASASEPDLSAFRSARAELALAVTTAPDPVPFLTELEAAYERERRYLARLVEIVGP